ncbi:MAG: protein-export membrane protein SecF [marine bacterium B5-7]|nr:MAG: protein-export membrane protein SecF [marine bacterium B5-7]
MKILKKETHFDFLGLRKHAVLISSALILVGLMSLVFRGLSFGIDFTGGTLVELRYGDSVEIQEVRDSLTDAGFDDAVVQHFGTSRDVMVRLPVTVEGSSAELSGQITNSLREEVPETLSDSRVGSLQQCVSVDQPQAHDCQVQMMRVEFVGPQVGDELAEQGGLAMIYALIGILIYVAWRFEWRFALASVIALIHDVLFTLGVFSLFQLEFSLPVLAAFLAVIGYSLNDTIVVFDRIRENFRKMRKGDTVTIMNNSINQTLSRTILTSMTTLVVILALLLVGGEAIRGFSTALFIGILVGTYSSIFVASPAVLALGIKREDMLPVQKEGAAQDSAP